MNLNGRATAPNDPLLRASLDPEMGKEILEHLARRRNLPVTGIVAGQSVATAIIELYGDGRRTAPLNDIDVFQMVDLDEFSEARSRTLGVDLESTRMSSANTARHIQVVNSSNHGLLNLIDLRFDFDPLRPVEKRDLPDSTTECRLFPGGMSTLDLVKTFDFNSIACGVDLETRKLAWAPEFEAFMVHPELKLINRCTPHSSLARMLKKLEAMPWMRADVDHMAQQCVLGMTAIWIQRGEFAMAHGHVETLARLDPEGRLPQSHTAFNDFAGRDITFRKRIRMPKGWSVDSFDGPLRQQAQDLITEKFWSELLAQAHAFCRDTRWASDPLAANRVSNWRMDGLYALQFPVHAAVLNRSPAELSSYIQERSIAGGVNARDGYGRTAAHWAAGLGRVESLMALIGEGSDLGLRDRSGMSPMDLMAENPGLQHQARCAVNARECRLFIDDIESVARTAAAPALV